MFATDTLSFAGSGAVLAVAAALSATPAPAGAAKPQRATLSCAASGTLEALVDCISHQMPQHDSNGFAVPTAAQSTDFAAVVTSMLEGNCDFALPASIGANMAIRSFTDDGNGRTYCLLMEVKSSVKSGFVDKGWGTFITHPAGARRISHHAPHPKFDTASTGSDEGDAYSAREAVRIFKRSDSRSYLMAGTRRSANLSASTCQGSYWQSDCAHNTANMYFPANVALDNFYAARGQDWTAIEWHSKSASTCSNDVFMSMGRNETPPAGSKLQLLKAAMEAQKPSWVIETTGGGGTCALVASTNTAGRMLNGVTATNACGTAATSASGKFLHIEQTTGLVGDLEATSTAWANALIAAFP
ncbi:hypothetical protein [Massilia glaciei]|uniref:Uncharacterized protein n=1 Tax=Massilia glaciei TaxID=1524097 RepID=A0A2U2HLU3_9BURK|nr:hypothetical protein [Massilia glaciei]PWF48439.1 hypothetical protein C7C56_012020 [Massilia glaciei]